MLLLLLLLRRRRLTQLRGRGNGDAGLLKQREVAPRGELDLGERGQAARAATERVGLLSMRVGDALETASVVDEAAGAARRHAGFRRLGRGRVRGERQLPLRRGRRRNDLAIARPLEIGVWR